MSDDNTTKTSPADPSSVKQALWNAFVVGLTIGAAFGFFDALVAWRTGTADLDVPAFAACAAAAIFEYTLVWSAALLVSALVLRPLLARRTAGDATLASVRIALLLGLFLELYWWSRPYVFPGYNSLSWQRLAATFVIAVVAIAIAFVLAKPVERTLRVSRRWLVPVLVLIATGGALHLFSESGSIGSKGARNARNDRVPNVLLVVVDALRQDTLGCYGHPRVKSPHIDRLAAEGVVFENAFTQAPFTLTSFGSFLTGKYPRRHGLISMAPDRRMRRDNVTLPSHLKRACTTTDASACLTPDDWLTASFHTGAISNGSGLLRGFDLYYEQMVGHGIVIADSTWSVFRSDLLLHLIADKTRTKVASGVPGVSRDWLANLQGQRFMAMVHLYSTHTPYDPDAKFRDMYVDPNYSGPYKSFYAVDRQAIDEGARVPTAADIAQIQQLYYAGVTQADDAIGRLVETLRARNVLDDTLVIVLSDHGESLGESGLGAKLLLEHDHMVQTNLRIPLVMRWPKGIAAGTRVGALVDEIDLLPTISELFGLALPPQPDENAKIDGKSLVPLLSKQADFVRPYSFAENGPYISAQDLRWKLVVPIDMIAPAEFEKGKNEYGDVPWLVDLASDPAESKNVLADHPEIVSTILAHLRAYDESMPIPMSDTILSPREVERQRNRIESQGYTGGEGGPGPKRPQKKPE
ncbi:MAG: sulfatase [Planctomycetota bacterium]|nr:sulfatase [Planctomycetota bacterium]